jgi:hypothetical protein
MARHFPHDYQVRERCAHVVGGDVAAAKAFDDALPIGAGKTSPVSSVDVARAPSRRSSTTRRRTSVTSTI